MGASEASVLYIYIYIYISIMIILFKYCADVENYESFRGFGFIYIYIYIDYFILTTRFIPKKKN